MGNTKRGFFINFEGNEGSGKTTQIELLRQKMFPVYSNMILFTRNPGGSAICEQIRDVILSKDNTGMDVAAEAFLYVAARAQMYREIIEPALDAGKIVVCDRFNSSTVAYQVYGRGLSESLITGMLKTATAGTEPDLEFWLRVNPEDGLRRRGKDTNRMDMQGLGFYKRVEQGYQNIYNYSLMQGGSRNIRAIAQGSIEENEEAIENGLKVHLLNWQDELLRRSGEIYEELKSLTSSSAAEHIANMEEMRKLQVELQHNIDMRGRNKEFLKELDRK